jgi:DNA polymerase III epsilon subunit-like protein
VKDAPVMSQQITEIMDFLSKADAIIGHNIEYDEDMIKVELKRLEKLHLYAPDQVICTMKTTVDFCALQ